MVYVADHRTIYPQPLTADNSADHPGITRRLGVYTDGSYTDAPSECPDAPPECAGWGALLVTPTALFPGPKHNEGHPCGELSGPVCLDPNHAEWFHATALTNNTAEISAIANVLAWCTRELTQPYQIHIYYDSQVAVDAILSNITVMTNANLVYCVTSLLLAVRRTHIVTFTHVYAHKDNLWNDGADSLAKRGAAGVRSYVTHDNILTFPVLTSEHLGTHNPDWSLTLHQTYLRTITPSPPPSSSPPLLPPSPLFDTFSADEDAAAFFNHEEAPCDNFSAEEEVAASDLFNLEENSPFNPAEWI